MSQLFPIAKAETRHLFIDPSIYPTWDIISPGYTGEQTGFIKPGRVDNLMDLCKKDGQVFTVTEEPDFDKLIIDGLIFGMHHQGYWQVFRIDSDFPIDKLDAGNWGIDGCFAIPTRDVINIASGEKGIKVPDTNIINIDIKLNYARGLRRLEFSNSGTYDNGRVQLLGITLDLQHKDSKL